MLSVVDVVEKCLVVVRRSKEEEKEERLAANAEELMSRLLRSIPVAMIFIS